MMTEQEGYVTQFYPERSAFVAVALLVAYSTPFQVRPMPDGAYEIRMKRSAAKAVNSAVNSRIGDL